MEGHYPASFKRSRCLRALNLGVVALVSLEAWQRTQAEGPA